MRKVLYILGLMTDQDVEWMATAGKRRRVPAGAVLIHQNRPCAYLYIILDGTIGVSIDGLGEVAQSGCGAIFGEMSFVDHRLPSATVTALEDSVVLELPVSAVQARLEEDVGFSSRFHRGIARFLSDRLRATIERLHARPPVVVDNELDIEALGTVQRASQSFDAMLKKLMTA